MCTSITLVTRYINYRPTRVILHNILLGLYNWVGDIWRDPPQKVDLVATVALAFFFPRSKSSDGLFTQQLSTTAGSLLNLRADVGLAILYGTGCE